MGYGHYTLPDGREAGYGVPDVCNRDGCGERIDRGLAYLCGEIGDGGEHGCGGYFCSGDLFYVAVRQGRFIDPPPQLCTTCVARWDAADAAEGRR